MDPAAELLGLLRKVRASQFSTTRFGVTSATANGSGLVKTSALGHSTVDFSETGVWSADDCTTFRFHNAYRWTRLDRASLRLEQIRLGPQHPVHLVDFKPAAVGATAWVSLRNHQCGNDSYSAELVARDDRVVLKWTISGPRKNERIESTYLRGPAL